MLRKGLCLVLIAAASPAACTQGSKNSGSLTIYFVGDLLLDRGVRVQIGKTGIASLFKEIKPVFKSADAVVVNLECPVTTRQAPINKRYIFRGEPVWLAALKDAGITHLVMANNHTCDQGRSGITDTRDNLVKNGLVPVGYGATQDNACEPVIIEKDGIRVALFSSVLVTLENWAYLPGSPGVCQATVADLQRRITGFKKVNTTCRVVVFLHWGAEFYETAMPEQRQQAAALIDAGADAIVGCHPHVVQPYVVYKGKPIFYSIGNFIFDQQLPAASRGEIVKLTFSKDGETFGVQPFVIKGCVPSPGH